MDVSATQCKAYRSCITLSKEYLAEHEFGRMHTTRSSEAACFVLRGAAQQRLDSGKPRSKAQVSLDPEDDVYAGIRLHNLGASIAMLLASSLAEPSLQKIHFLSEKNVK